MLTVAEETMLLGYAGRGQTDAPGAYDVSYLSGQGGQLVGAALLMDLALRGRVRMEHPRSPEQRTRRGAAVVAGVLSVGVFLLLLFGGMVLLTRQSGIPSPVTILVPFVALALLAVVLGIVGAVRAEKMLVVETSPTGNPVLDEALQGMLRVGARARIVTYLRRAFLRRSLFVRYSDGLRRQLEAQGLLDTAGQRTAFFGLIERSHVNRAHPEFQAIGDRVQRLVLQGDIPDANVVALAVVFSERRIVLSRGRPQWGLDQFFSPEELPMLKRRLKEIRRGDPSIGAQLGNDLYDCLVAIEMALEELKRQNSGGG